jgi:hypothetical protein
MHKPTASILEGFLLIKKTRTKWLKVKQEGKRETGLWKKKQCASVN